MQLAQTSSNVSAEFEHITTIRPRGSTGRFFFFVFDGTGIPFVVRWLLNCSFYSKRAFSKNIIIILSLFVYQLLPRDNFPFAIVRSILLFVYIYTFLCVFESCFIIFHSRYFVCNSFVWYGCCCDCETIAVGAADAHPKENQLSQVEMSKVHHGGEDPEGLVSRDFFWASPAIFFVVLV